jgi:hypothetical protein
MLFFLFISLLPFLVAPVLLFHNSTHKDKRKNNKKSTKTSNKDTRLKKQKKKQRDHEDLKQSYTKQKIER